MSTKLIINTLQTICFRFVKFEKKLPHCAQFEEYAFGGNITYTLKMNVSTSSCLLFNFPSNIKSARKFSRGSSARRVNSQIIVVYNIPYCCARLA